jgi:polysaccharide pyruvyl transferase WcaK-like protein
MTETRRPINVTFSNTKIIRKIHNSKSIINRLLWRADRFLGARGDFLHSSDPAASAMDVVQYRGEHPELDQLYRDVEAADTVVIDGDGSLVLRDSPGRMLHLSMALIHLCKKLDTPVHYVNSILSDSSVTGRNKDYLAVVLNTLRLCSSVLLRDPDSVDLLRTVAPDIDCEMVPDSLFAWFRKTADLVRNMPSDGDLIIPHGEEKRSTLGRLDFSGEFICVSGGSRAAGQRSISTERYIRLIKRLRSLGYPIYLVPTCRGDEFLESVSRETNTPLVPVRISVHMGTAIIAKSRLLISGRYHPSIMAAMGGAPCIFFEADSHKALSLQRLLGYDEPVQFSSAPTDSEIDAILARSQELLQQGEELRTQIKNAAYARYEEACRLPAFIAEATEAALSERAPVRSTTR